MEIKGKVHCFFEQSGTFKNEFIKLGIPAEDYDIQNNFGETDHVIDLFGEIEKAYGGGNSIFDKIVQDDLIIAFFPCIYFCEKSQLSMTWDYINYRNLSIKEKTDKILQRSKDRQYFFELVTKLYTLCYVRGIRIIIENPYSPVHYLIQSFGFVAKPKVIDKDRMSRGDYFKKPTAYWFGNCEPTKGLTYQRDKEKKTIENSKPASHAGLCSEERSMISPDYARNFICDFIIGKRQSLKGMQLSLFDPNEI